MHLHVDFVWIFCRGMALPALSENKDYPGCLLGSWQTEYGPLDQFGKSRPVHQLVYFTVGLVTSTVVNTLVTNQFQNAIFSGNPALTLLKLL